MYKSTSRCGWNESMSDSMSDSYIQKVSESFYTVTFEYHRAST